MSPSQKVALMLTSLRQSDLQKVIADDTTKAEGPFMCPKCSSETILRKGMIKIHHFAHKPPIACEYGKGESEQHRKCKSEIYSYLSKHINITCELEKDLGNVVPDIYIDFGYGKSKYAIEVQISHLTMSSIISRTREYGRLGIYVLWLPIYNKVLEEQYLRQNTRT
jgi:competence protein CoiA